MSHVRWLEKKKKKGPKVKHYWWEIKSEESSTAHSHWPQLASQMPIAICLIVQVPSPRNASPLHYIFTTRPSHFRTPACPFNSTAALEGWLILHAIYIYIYSYSLVQSSCEKIILLFKFIKRFCVRIPSILFLFAILCLFLSFLLLDPACTDEYVTNPIVY